VEELTGPFTGLQSGLLEECRILKAVHRGSKNYKGIPSTRKMGDTYCRPCMAWGQKGEDDLLASCYRKSLELAREYAVKIIAFPAISTGAYGFPSERAAELQFPK